MRRAKRPEHYLCDKVEPQFTPLSSLGVKWSQVQILSARLIEMGIDLRRSFNNTSRLVQFVRARDHVSVVSDHPGRTCPIVKWLVASVVSGTFHPAHGLQ